MENPVVVLEGPRLAGKTYLFDNLKNKFQNSLKDETFIYREYFSFIASPDRLESYLVGKDVSLTQRINALEGSVLVDRYLFNTAVYSSIFRSFPDTFGEEYLKEFDTFLRVWYKDLRERLHFFVIIPDIEEALKQGIKGREGKDGLKDDEELLFRQCNLFIQRSMQLTMMGYNIKVIPSYHTNPNILEDIENDVWLGN